MKMTKNLMNMVLGIILIVIGLALSFDFILQLGIAALGVFLIIIGVGLLTGRR